jgi:acetylornithine deacetylase/succinyl-diaminopimelate desuccinylase-like protein
MIRLKDALAFARDNGQRFEAELGAFIRFASISAQPRHAGDTARCAAWLADRLTEIGLERVHLIQTPGHPIVRASWRRASGAQTVLIYGHYDVQPAEPLEDGFRRPSRRSLAETTSTEEAQATTKDRCSST